MSIALYLSGFVLVLATLAQWWFIWKVIDSQGHRVESITIKAPWELVVGILLIGAGRVVAQLGF